MSNEHNGKHYLLTGAAGGVGSATARHFAAAGARLTLVDNNAQGLADLTQSILTQTGVSVDTILSCPADVSRPSDVAAYVDAAVARHGRIHGFLNNAVVEGPALPIEEYPVEDFERVIDINVKGVWLGMKYVLPAIDPAGGSIVIMSSVAGTIGSPGLSAYVTSKHAVIGIMRTACLEVAARNIRVNTVHPGMVDTEMARRIGAKSGLGEAEFAEVIRATIPLARYAQPEDVAAMVAFLFSDAAAYCNGSEYFVDGGMRAGN